MKSNSTCLEIRVGFVMILGLCILGFFIAKTQDLHFSKQGYELKVHYTDVQGLKPNSNVYLSGVKIGEVNSIDVLYQEGVVEVNLWVEEGIKIPVTSKARIAANGFFGDKSVWVSMGKLEGGFLKNGQMLEAEYSTDINQALSAIARVIGKSEEFIDAGTDLMVSVKEDAKQISTRVVAILDENRANIKTTIANFADVGPDLKKTMHNAANVMERFESSDGTLWKLLKEDDIYNYLKDASRNIDEILANNKDNISNFMKALGQASGSIKTTFEALKVVMDKIKNGQGTIGKLIHDDSLYYETKKTVKEIGDAAESFKDETTLGSMAGLVVGAAK